MIDSTVQIRAQLDRTEIEAGINKIEQDLRNMTQNLGKAMQGGAGQKPFQGVIDAAAQQVDQLEKLRAQVEKTLKMQGVPDDQLKAATNKAVQAVQRAEQEAVAASQKANRDILASKKALGQQRLREEQRTARKILETRKALSQQRQRETEAEAKKAAMAKIRESRQILKVQTSLNQQRLREEQRLNSQILASRKALSQQHLKETERAAKAEMQANRRKLESRKALNAQKAKAIRLAEKEAAVASLAGKQLTDFTRKLETSRHSIYDLTKAGQDFATSFTMRPVQTMRAFAASTDKAAIAAQFLRSELSFVMSSRFGAAAVMLPALYQIHQALSDAYHSALDLEVAGYRIQSAWVLDGATDAAVQSTRAMGQARIMAVKYGGDVNEIADALQYAAEAGFNYEESVAATENALKLSIIAGANMEEVIMSLSGVYNLFADNLTELEGPHEKLSYMSGMLYQVWTKSRGAISDMTKALEYAGNNAELSGAKFQQILKVVGILNDRMIMGSKAGTSLNSALQQLTKKGPEVMSKMAEAMDIDFQAVDSPWQSLMNFMEAANKKVKETKLSWKDLQEIAGNFRIRGARATATLIAGLAEGNEKYTFTAEKIMQLDRQVNNLVQNSDLYRWKRLWAGIKNELIGITQDGVTPILWAAEKLGGTMTWLIGLLNQAANGAKLVFSDAPNVVKLEGELAELQFKRKKWMAQGVPKAEQAEASTFGRELEYLDRQIEKQEAVVLMAKRTGREFADAEQNLERLKRTQSALLADIEEGAQKSPADTALSQLNKQIAAKHQEILDARLQVEKTNAAIEAQKKMAELSVRALAGDTDAIQEFAELQNKYSEQLKKALEEIREAKRKVAEENFPGNFLTSRQELQLLEATKGSFQERLELAENILAKSKEEYEWAKKHEIEQGKFNEAFQEYVSAQGTALALQKESRKAAEAFYATINREISLGGKREDSGIEADLEQISKRAQRAREEIDGVYMSALKKGGADDQMFAAMINRLEEVDQKAKNAKQSLWQDLWSETHLKLLDDHSRKVSEVVQTYEILTVNVMALYEKGMIDQKGLLEYLDKIEARQKEALGRIEEGNQDTAEEVSEIWEGAYDRMTEALADWIYEGEVSFDSLVEYAKRAASEAAAAWIMEDFVGLGKSGSGNGGGFLGQIFNSGGSSGGGGFNFSSLFGGDSSAGGGNSSGINWGSAVKWAGKGWNTVSNWFGGGTAAAGTAAGASAGASAGTSAAAYNAGVGYGAGANIASDATLAQSLGGTSLSGSGATASSSGFSMANVSWATWAALVYLAESMATKANIKKGYGRIDEVGGMYQPTGPTTGDDFFNEPIFTYLRGAAGYKDPTATAYQSRLFSKHFGWKEVLLNPFEGIDSMAHSGDLSDMAAASLVASNDPLGIFEAASSDIGIDFGEIFGYGNKKRSYLDRSITARYNPASGKYVRSGDRITREKRHGEEFIGGTADFASQVLDNVNKLSDSLRNVLEPMGLEKSFNRYLSRFGATASGGLGFSQVKGRRRGLNLDMHIAGEDSGEVEASFRHMEEAVTEGIFRPIAKKATNLMTRSFRREWRHLDTDVFVGPVARELKKSYRAAIRKMRIGGGEFEDELKEIGEGGKEVRGVIDYIKQITEITDQFSATLDPLTEYEKAVQDINANYAQAGSILASLGVNLKKTNLELAKQVELEEARLDYLTAPIAANQRQINDLFGDTSSPELIMQSLGIKPGSLGIMQYLEDTDRAALTAGFDRLNTLLEEGEIAQGDYNSAFGALIDSYKTGQGVIEEYRKSLAAFQEDLTINDFSVADPTTRLSLAESRLQDAVDSGDYGNVEKYARDFLSLSQKYSNLADYQDDYATVQQLLNQSLGFADGGTISGPTSGYYLPPNTQFHGTEHIIPGSEMGEVKEELAALRKLLEMLLNTAGDQNSYARKTWRILDGSQRGELPLTTETAT